ncbi:OmpG porin family protein [Vibrio pelagius]|uniref:OmpG porin family protein n=1 Tax=Vibrio pelagius TaxID=28169 RepID=UPI0035515DA0
MKKTVVASSILFSLTLSGYAFANDTDESAGITPELKSKVQALSDEFSKAEILTAIGYEKPENSKLHGSLGTNLEVERFNRDDGISEGKLKYTLAQGNFSHEDLPGWGFGFYSAREELFSGNLKHADYNRGVNAIQEVWINKSNGFDGGSWGWQFAMKGESIDKRTTPEGKVFGNYQLTDRLDIHGYAMYHVEYKRGAGEFRFWEIEPGFGYKIADNMGAWINFRYQEGEWHDKSAGHVNSEAEWIIKPGIWRSFGDFSASIWGEFGGFEKTRESDGATEWTEDYAKVGVSANYPLTKHWRLFGEVSYKTIDFNKKGINPRMDGDTSVGIIGVNYSF